MYDDMLRYLFYIIILIGWPALAQAHVFYISITKVKWNAQHERLDISVRIFTDNLEEAVAEDGGPVLKLWTDKEHTESDRFIADYLKSRLHFRVNEKVVDLEYLGKADALDATACFFQIRGIKDVKKMDVENSILINLYDTQANVVRFEVKEEKKFINLNKKSTRGAVDF
jgi:hypothetical protein